MPSDEPALTASMRPNVMPGDDLLVFRSPGVSPPGLARCVKPDDPTKFVVGRVLGDTGDEVAVTNFVVTVKGRRAPSPRKCEPTLEEVRDVKNDRGVVLECWFEDMDGFPDLKTLRTQQLETFGEPPWSTTVEPDSRVLISDDRTVHQDSRDFGQVKRDQCQRIFIRLWSAQGFLDEDHRFNML